MCRVVETIYPQDEAQRGNKEVTFCHRAHQPNLCDHVSRSKYYNYDTTSSQLVSMSAGIKDYPKPDGSKDSTLSSPISGSNSPITPGFKLPETRGPGQAVGGYSTVAADPRALTSEYPSSMDSGYYSSSRETRSALVRREYDEHPGIEPVVQSANMLARSLAEQEDAKRAKALAKEEEARQARIQLDPYKVRAKERAENHLAEYEKRRYEERERFRAERKAREEREAKEKAIKEEKERLDERDAREKERKEKEAREAKARLEREAKEENEAKEKKEGAAKKERNRMEEEIARRMKQAAETEPKEVRFVDEQQQPRKDHGYPTISMTSRFKPSGRDIAAGSLADDGYSTTSTTIGSIFSEESGASSATDISKSTGYPVSQVSATREVFFVLQNDEVLQVLYAIGPSNDPAESQRFRNEFARLLEICSVNLRSEARDALGNFTAMLLGEEAASLADLCLENHLHRLLNDIQRKKDDIDKQVRRATVLTEEEEADQAGIEFEQSKQRAMERVQKGFAEREKRRYEERERLRAERRALERRKVKDAEKQAGREREVDEVEKEGREEVDVRVEMRVSTAREAKERALEEDREKALDDDRQKALAKEHREKALKEDKEKAFEEAIQSSSSLKNPKRTLIERGLRTPQMIMMERRLRDSEIALKHAQKQTFQEAQQRLERETRGKNWTVGRAHESKWRDERATLTANRAVIRNFFVKSNAFKLLRLELQQFVLTTMMEKGEGKAGHASNLASEKDASNLQSNNPPEITTNPPHHSTSLQDRSMEIYTPLSGALSMSAIHSCVSKLFATAEPVTVRMVKSFYHDLEGTSTEGNAIDDAGSVIKGFLNNIVARHIVGYLLSVNEAAEPPVTKGSPVDGGPYVDDEMNFGVDENGAQEAQPNMKGELTLAEKRHVGWLIQRGFPFREVVLTFRLRSLPLFIRDIITTVPKASIKISLGNDTSLANKAKGAVEDHTRCEWDWWPLAPRKPDLEAEEKRLEWKIGQKSVFHKISVQEADLISELFELMPEHPSRCYCCKPDVWAVRFDRPTFSLRLRIRPTFSLSLSFGPQTDAGDASNSSTAAGRSSPSGPISMTSSAVSNSTNSQSGDDSTVSQTGESKRSISPQIQGSSSGISTSSTLVEPNWVLFGIQGSRWSLELEQIRMPSMMNDPTFFRELRARYKKHRHWIKLLFSPFRFRFCRFVKFEKFDADRVLSSGEGLPDYDGFDYDYDYNPRPGKIPLIDPKTFAVCLTACGSSCIWALLNPWHDCIRLPLRAHRIRRIPKKKSAFDMSSDDTDEVAWGIEADYALSFAFLAVYHFVPILAAAGFWGYWLWKHPGDFQDASVPILTVLALLALLWMPFGKRGGVVSAKAPG